MYNMGLLNVIGTFLDSYPPLLIALVEISFTSVGRAWLTLREVPGSNPFGDIAFIGGITSSTVACDSTLQQIIDNNSSTPQ
jgi:hypothetical protein